MALNFLSKTVVLFGHDQHLNAVSVYLPVIAHMSAIRKVVKILKAKETIEGAGVRLHRAFGYYEVPNFDPFLMLDDFRADRPEDYLPGFPWHPHRGIETVTYMFEGKVEHCDSMGNAGIVGAGDVQWMTAGSGIIHQEMPKPVKGRMGGFQLWVNLPRVNKMMDPRYQEIKHEQIPTIEISEGVTGKIICGSINSIVGPVHDIIADPEYFDITIEEGVTFSHPVKNGYTVFTYVINGEGEFEPNSNQYLHNHELALFGDGTNVQIRPNKYPLRFLFFSGKPIGEPVAWGGPIVMNTQAELTQAFREYQDGTFIKIQD